MLATTQAPQLGWKERSRIVPTLSSFYGIMIRMYYREHEPAHFHADYQGQQGTFDFMGNPIAGAFRSRTALRLIREWSQLHRAELERNWERMKAGEALDRIEPLD